MMKRAHKNTQHTMQKHTMPTTRVSLTQRHTQPKSRRKGVPAGWTLHPGAVRREPARHGLVQHSRPLTCGCTAGVGGGSGAQATHQCSCGQLQGPATVHGPGGRVGCRALVRRRRFRIGVHISVGAQNRNTHTRGSGGRSGCMWLREPHGTCQGPQHKRTELGTVPTASDWVRTSSA